MSHIVHIGGAKGVGKTTVLSELSKEKAIGNQTLHTFQMSGYLSELAQVSFGKSWKDMDDAERVRARIMAVNSLKESPADVVLLDSHCIDMDGDCPKCIMPDEFKWIIDSYIVLTAPWYVILQRRQKDQKTRERDLDPFCIKKEMEWELKIAQELSKEKGTRVTIIENIVLEKAVRGIRDHIDFILASRETRAEERMLNETIKFHNNERI